jgi:3-oxoacyl-[acyl-carrier protein] reductase
MSHSPEKTLTGKVALITGASRGIGAATARLLAKMGATVLINYGRSANQAQQVVADIRATGAQAHLLPGDVGHPAAVEKMFEQIDQLHGGKLDVLVNNAGVYITGMMSDFKPEDFTRTFDVNVRSIFEVTRRAIPRMSGGGRIINIGSILGERVPFPGVTVYSASKFAVAGLSRGWARELAPRGITVNVVQPGPIDTEMNPDKESNPEAAGIRALVPLGRYGNADELAGLVGFLASPASSYITGAVMTVDGGVLA